MHAPVLEAGADVFEIERPLDPGTFDADWFADQLARLMLIDLAPPRGQHVAVDGSLDATLEYLLRAWYAWRGSRTGEALAQELEPALRVKLADEAERLQESIAKLPDRLVDWPRDADRVSELARAATAALDANHEPGSLFDDLARRLGR